MTRQAVKTIEQIEEELEPVKDKRKELKDFEVFRVPEGLYVIKFNAGGEVPDVLKGRWTSMVKAEAAIENYKEIRRQEHAKAA